MRLCKSRRCPNKRCPSSVGSPKAVGKEIMIKRFNKKALIPVALLLCTMVAIYLFSAQNGDDSNGLSSVFSRLFGKLLFSGFDKMSEAQQLFIVTGLNHFIRKLAHFTAYMFMGICSYAFFYLAEIRLKGAYLPAVILCAAYACLDEVHQLFTPGRTGQFTDILLDTSGAAVGAALAVVAVVIVRNIKSYSARKRKYKFGGFYINGRK